jgi:outer membrane receptor protein involved in Fe transport
VDLKAQGEFGHVPAGRFGMAVGATYTNQQYKDQSDDRSVNDEVFGNAGSNGGGGRDTRAVYSEFAVPLTKKLELQVAGRYDQYSDFGDTTNPKLAALYRPVPSVLLRGSVGTGFKAPLMQDLYAASSNGNPTFIDAVACAKERAAGGATPSCVPRQYNVTSSGNTGLKEERSISYNASVMYEPNRDFSIGSDFFLTKMKNVVGIDYDDAMEAERDLGAGALASRGVVVTRDPSTGLIDNIEAPLQNLSAQEVAGVDFATSYRMWKFKLGTEHSQLFYFKEEGFPGTGLKNKLGRNGRPPWRNTTSLAFAPNERHDFTLAAITIAGHEKAVREMGKLNNYTSFDFQYSYKTRKIGTFTAGVKNLLDSIPPLDDSNPGSPLDETLYDQVGRALYTGYKATF